ncbi:ribonuclease H-like domain-containing protein [Tanacetum coccineum]
MNMSHQADNSSRSWADTDRSPALKKIKRYLSVVEVTAVSINVTTAGYVSTAGEVQRKYSKSLLLLVVKLLLLVLVTTAKRVSAVRVYSKSMLYGNVMRWNSFKPAAQTTTNADGTSTTLIPGLVTTEEKYKDAKTLFAAIQTRFGGNKATKKTQKTLLKQMYKNFSTPRTKSLNSIFNRLQKIVSQLAILDENISQEDLNLKFLRSLPSEWNTHVVELHAQSSSSSSSSQNMAFVSSPSSTNEVNTAYGVSTANTQVSPASTQVSTASTQVSTANLSDDTVYAFLASQPNGSQLVYEDLEQIHEDDIEEMDLKWQLALLSMRTRRGPRNQDSRNRNQDSSRRTVNVEETSSKAMVAIDGAGFDWSYMADDEVPTNMALMAFSDSEFNKFEFNLATYKRGLASIEKQLVFYKKNKVIFCEQLAVLKRDISYKDSEISMLKSQLEKLKQEKESNQLKIEKFDNASKSLDKLIRSQITDKSRKGVGGVQQPKFEDYESKTSKSVSEDISNEVRESPDTPLVEELVSNDKLEKKTVFLTFVKIEFVRPKHQEKPVRKPDDCNYHQRERMVSGNNYTRVNYNYSAKKAHPSAHMNVVPRAVLMQTGLRPLNTARPINTAHPKTIGHLQKEDQGYIDSECSKHMTENMSYLSDFKEFNRGYVTFRRGAKGGKITSKGTLKTANESQVLLKVPRKNNMYSVDIKNIVAKESLTCLVAKATLDESTLWHRRLGHVNFKTINKLVMENLVRGLPTKRFENDQTCVA